mgnify:CR=1 FL=1
MRLFKKILKIAGTLLLVVLVAGGDGTVCEAAEGLAASGGRCELAILPLGTGNDGAYHATADTTLAAGVGLALERPGQLVEQFRRVDGGHRRRHIESPAASGPRAPAATIGAVTIMRCEDVRQQLDDYGQGHSEG